MSYQNPVFNPYYQNPMYGNSFMQQPQQFISQQMPMQQSQQGLGGKIVESYEVFKSVDIPMDGNTYYFPKADGTEVYSKRWLQNGTTEQVVYKVFEEQKEEKENPLMQKLNVIEEQINLLQDAIVKQTKSSSKKEN